MQGNQQKVKNNVGALRRHRQVGGQKDSDIKLKIHLHACMQESLDSAVETKINKQEFIILCSFEHGHQQACTMAKTDLSTRLAERKFRQEESSDVYWYADRYTIRKAFGQVFRWVGQLNESSTDCQLWYFTRCSTLPEWKEIPFVHLLILKCDRNAVFVKSMSLYMFLLYHFSCKNTLYSIQCYIF